MLKPERVSRLRVHQRTRTPGNMAPVYLSMKANMSQLIRREVFKDVEHIVVPVIMMVEGVHNGILYTNDELSKFPDAWNGKPVVVYHPEMDGQPVCANQKDILETRQIGIILNAKFEDGKLKAEMYIDPTKADGIDVDVMQIFNANGIMEVSIGVFEEDEITAGTWDGGEAYEMIAHNLRPDHLAVLPKAVGACSVEDGAGGPRINKRHFSSFTGRLNALASLNIKSHEKHVIKEGISLNKLHDDLDEKLRAKTDRMLWIHDIVGDVVIYEMEMTNGFMLFQRSFEMDDETEISLLDDETEVRLVVSYEPVANPTGNAQQETPTGDDPMDELIDQLVTNEATRFTDDDREWLSTLSEDNLKKMLPNPAAPVEPVTSEGDDEAAADTGMTPDQVQAMIDARVEERLAANAAAPIIDRIIANGCALERETLQNMGDAELRELDRKYSPVQTFHGRAPVNHDDEDDSNAVPPRPLCVLAGKEG